MLCRVVHFNPDAKVRDSTADSLFNSGINIVIPSIWNCVNVSCHSGSDTISTVNGHANNIIRNILLLKKKKKSYVLSDAGLPLIVLERIFACFTEKNRT